MDSPYHPQSLMDFPILKYSHTPNRNTGTALIYDNNFASDLGSKKYDSDVDLAKFKRDVPAGLYLPPKKDYTMTGGFICAYQAEQ